MTTSSTPQMLLNAIPLILLLILLGTTELSAIELVGKNVRAWVNDNLTLKIVDAKGHYLWDGEEAAGPQVMIRGSDDQLHRNSSFRSGALPWLHHTAQFIYRQRCRRRPDYST